MDKVFFAGLQVQQLLVMAIANLETSAQSEKVARLTSGLRIIKEHAAEFDSHADWNIRFGGPALKDALGKIAREHTVLPPVTDEAISLLYRIFQEFDLSTKNDVSFELRQFMAFVKDRIDSFSVEAQRSIRFASTEMPIAIMKSLLGSDGIQKLINVEEYSKSVDVAINGWITTLNAQEERVTTLNKALERYETAFNFAGLFQGFDEFSKAKSKELLTSRIAMWVLGALAISPATIEIVYMYQMQKVLESLFPTLIASALPAISLTVLIVYFFRLAVRSADNVKSQLLQIELRKTLCRFIQSYTKYAKEVNLESPNLLAKFEKIIFSSIVLNDEKIPATFDGVEQLASLFKAVKSPD